MAALGKRPTPEQRLTALDSRGQPFITDAELAEAEGVLNRGNVTPLWALCMQDSGLVAPGHEDNAYDLIQHAKRQREEMKKEEEENKIKEAAQKKQKTEEDSNAECDCGICECKKKGMAVAVMCDKKMSRYYDKPTEEDCKACAFEQQSPSTHMLRHTCGASNIHLDWCPEHDEDDEDDEKE